MYGIHNYISLTLCILVKPCSLPTYVACLNDQIMFFTRINLSFHFLVEPT